MAGHSTIRRRCRSVLAAVLMTLPIPVLGQGPGQQPRDPTRPFPAQVRSGIDVSRTSPSSR
jgi:hypothetical protein